LVLCVANKELDVHMLNRGQDYDQIARTWGENEDMERKGRRRERKNGESEREMRENEEKGSD